MAKAVKKSKLKAVPAAQTMAKPVPMQPVAAPHEDDSYDEQAAAQAEAQQALQAASDAQGRQDMAKVEEQHNPDTALRDMFAMAAMQATAATVGDGQRVAKIAWDLAEAMMAERAKRYG